jgi:8-oxo-dGTP pyrophosphatase MutT (NUDIX family)
MSPYMQHLRELVGPTLLLIPSVAVLPTDEDGRVLLGFHPEVGVWSTLGGAIDPDETPEEAARREVAEEAGVTIEIEELLAVLGGPEHRTRYGNGDEVAYVAAVYRGSIVGGALRPDGVEVDELRWTTRDEIAGLVLSPIARGALEALGWR